MIHTGSLSAEQWRPRLTQVRPSTGHSDNRFGRGENGSCIAKGEPLRQAFATDALQLATIMMTIQNDVKAADDPRTAYLVQGLSAIRG